MSGFDLFVYGTLRRGGAAAELLAQCAHRGAATVTGMLYDVEGRYPALVHYGAERVHGEVWRCPAELLLELDRYESVGAGLFRRMAVEAELADGSVTPCWVYVAGPAISLKLTPDRRIVSGEWRHPSHAEA